MKWKKKFSAGKSILGTGRQRMEMSASCFFLWSASYLKLRLQQPNSKFNIIQQQVQATNILGGPAERMGLLLVHMGAIIITNVVVFVCHIPG